MGGKKKAAKAKAASSAAEAEPAPEPVSEEVAVAAPAQEEPVEMPVETAPAPAEPASAPVVAATGRPRKARPQLSAPHSRGAQPPAGALGQRGRWARHDWRTRWPASNPCLAAWCRGRPPGAPWL